MAERYCRHDAPKSAETRPGPDRRAGE